jgi:phosphate transport system substrate-binding protein
MTWNHRAPKNPSHPYAACPLTKSRDRANRYGPIWKVATAIFLLTVTSIPAWPDLAGSQELEIRGDGSTFAYPMYSKWIEEYQKQNPGVRFTYQSNGSGAGIHDVMLGIVDFAGTDGPLNKTQMLDFSTHRNCEVLHFPVALGADVPIYNIPGVTHELRFTPAALAAIYLGNTTKWNDALIADANPGVTLPNNDIVVIHRQDGSGTTYVWTDYLSKVSAQWHERVGTGIAVVWPVGRGARGNEGVVELISHTPYSIGYSELTYAVQNHLTYGTVANSSGRFVKANFASVTAAAAGLADKMPADFRVSITDSPDEAAYPISSFTWMLIPSVVSEAQKRAALVEFLRWGLTTGQGMLDELSYARLPDAVIAKEQSAIDQIKVPSTTASSIP